MHTTTTRQETKLVVVGALTRYSDDLRKSASSRGYAGPHNASQRAAIREEANRARALADLIWTDAVQLVDCRLPGGE